jgi:hypothetical protein
MGNSCCNNAKDEFSKDYGKMKKKTANANDPEMKKLLEEAKRNEDKIIKL